MDDPITRFVSAIDGFLTMNFDFDPPAVSSTEGRTWDEIKRSWEECKRTLRKIHTAVAGVQPEINERLGLIDQRGAAVLELTDDEPATRSVFVPGEDHSAELDQVNATIDRLRLESDAGLLTTPEDERQWLERMKVQVAKRDQLAAMPSRAAGWVTEETGQTKRDAWMAADEGDWRQLHLDAGLLYVLCRKPERSYFDRSHTLTPQPQSS